MTLKLHNTLTKSVDIFSPLKPDVVSIYSCGPTVYDHVHIGNLSAFIVADTLRRVIANDDTTVKHVMNFTDVDDKTIRRSHEKYPDIEPRKALHTLTEEYGALFLDDMAKVGNDTQAITFIKAADDATIEGMRELITELYETGFAYIADDGVYFSIEAYKKSGKVYGQLVEITTESTSNERIQNDEYDKESIHDFALWKIKKPGEPAWEFTLDEHDLTGRPGWHIECSVMSYMGLGQPFDIHTGGIDLMFPHHENEIAQSTAGKKNSIYASTFVHNEHILVDGKKMSKSLGNFYTLDDIIQKGVNPLAFRLLVLQAHYRSQTNFSIENAKAAHNRLQHWRAIAALRWQVGEEDSEGVKTEINEVLIKFIAALEDDINTPEALRIVDELFSKIENGELRPLSSMLLHTIFHYFDSILGLQLRASTPDISEQNKAFILEREKARENKDWNESDRLRDSLLAEGIVIKDTPSGSVWSYL